MLITNSKLQINHERRVPRDVFTIILQRSLLTVLPRALVKARLIQINSECHQNAQNVDRILEKEMRTVEAPSSPAVCKYLVPLFLIREKQGQGLSELAGLGLDRVKLFPSKPWGAARGPYEENQPPLWLTHVSRLEESCLIAIPSIFTLLWSAVSLL